MSIQTAKEFLVKIATDVAAASKAQAAHESSLLNLARQMGYTLSESELRQALDEVDELDELSEAQLSSISGGRRRMIGDT